jgi:hypothetical protein
MNRLMLITFLYLFLSQIAFSQDKEVYFIIGHPFLEIERQFEASIVKFERDTLIDIIELANEKEILYFIKVYDDLNLITFFKENKDDLAKKIFIQVNTANSFKRDSIIFTQKSTFIESTRIEENNQAYLCLYLFRRNEEEKQLFQGVNLNELSTKEFTPQSYNNSVLIGSPGGALQGDDYLNVYYYPEDGKLHIPKTPKAENRPIFPVVIPSGLIPDQKELFSIIINNNKYFVLESVKSEPEKDEIGYTDLIIKDKPQNETYKYRIKGNQAYLRNFGDWLAGEIVSSNIKVVRDGKGKVKERINFERVSPGIEERRKSNTQTGAPFDDRALRFKKVYYPGILYLYNIASKKYIEWNTGQGDSEILLIQDKTVYYRVNDKIFKVQILSGDKLGKLELLIQDERVPDIHWAFLR